MLNAHEASNSMKIGMGIEAALIVFIGLFPGELITVAMRTLGTDFGSLRGGLWGVFWLRNMSDLAVYSPVLLLILAVVLVAVLALPLMGTKVFAQRELTWNCGTLPTRRQQYQPRAFPSPCAAPSPLSCVPAGSGFSSPRNTLISAGGWSTA